MLKTYIIVRYGHRTTPVTTSLRCSLICILRVLCFCNIAHFEFLLFTNHFLFLIVFVFPIFPLRGGFFYLDAIQIFPLLKALFNGLPTNQVKNQDPNQRFLSERYSFTSNPFQQISQTWEFPYIKVMFQEAIVFWKIPFRPNVEVWKWTLDVHCSVAQEQIKIKCSTQSVPKKQYVSDRVQEKCFWSCGEKHLVLLVSESSCLYSWCLKRPVSLVYFSLVSYNCLDYKYKKNNQWEIHQWLKVLLNFKINK